MAQFSPLYAANDEDDQQTVTLTTDSEEKIEVTLEDALDSKETTYEVSEPVGEIPAPAAKKPAPAETKKPVKKGGAQHKEGILSPLVFATKKVLGVERLNKIRAKAISLHSDAIKMFVDTADSKVGEAILAQLFVLVDENRDGILSEEELNKGLQKLGFTWLGEKQVKGILKRSDSDSNGVVDVEEFFSEAPKTLKTNLIKLAKKNGADLGLLV
jgi:hypothetical protein